jgi:polysaccharide biosynthesis protein PslG
MSVRTGIAKALCFMVCLCCLLSPEAHAQTFRQWIADNGDHPRVGVQVKIDRFTSEQAKRIKAAGFAFVRLGVWSNAMGNAAYEKQVDDAFEAAHSAGLPVLVTARSTVPLVPPNADNDERARQLRVSAADLSHAIRALVRAHGPDILAVELWNEPEWPKYWPTGDLDTTFPVYMQAVCEGVVALGRTTPVIGFGFATAPTAGSKSDALLHAMDSASPHCLDAISWHAYGKTAREIADASDYVRARYGIPTVITEWGVSSGTRGGESAQASAIHAFLAERGALKAPLISIYEWQDTAKAQNAKERHFGLVDAMAREKPALGMVVPLLEAP